MEKYTPEWFAAREQERENERAAKKVAVDAMGFKRIPLPRAGGHIYQAQTEFGTFQLWHRNAMRRGRQLKYKQWVLYRNGAAVSGSKCYKLSDAKAFAAEHLASLVARRERRH